MNYNGRDKWKKEVTDILNQGSTSKVQDVKVNGKSVVKEGTANVVVPSKVSDLEDGNDYYTSYEVNSITNAIKNNIANNLLVSPYSNQDLTDRYGLHFEINDDNSITVTGTPTQTTYFYLSNKTLTLKPGTYTLSGISNGSSETYRLNIRDNASNNIKFVDNGSGTFTITEKTKQPLIVRYAFYGGDMGGMTLYPMLEKGDTSHDFVNPALNSQNLLNNKADKDAFDEKIQTLVLKLGWNNDFLQHSEMSTATGYIESDELECYMYDENTDEVKEYIPDIPQDLINFLSISSANEYCKIYGDLLMQGYSVYAANLYALNRITSKMIAAQEIKCNTLPAEEDSKNVPNSEWVKDLMADNLTPYPYYSNNGYYTNNTYTSSGITYNINSDGSVTSEPGTASALTLFYFCYALKVPKGTYTISGINDGNINTDRYIRVYDRTSGSNVNIATDYGEGATFTLTRDSLISVAIRQAAKSQLAYVFKPMLEVGTKAHSYKPTPNSRASLAKLVNDLVNPQVASMSLDDE